MPPETGVNASPFGDGASQPAIIISIRDNAGGVDCKRPNIDVFLALHCSRHVASQVTVNHFLLEAESSFRSKGIAACKQWPLT